VIFVDPGRAAQPGDRVVVRLEAQQQATFKQYLEEDGRKYLRALNPDWRPKIIEINGEATICGVVIGKWVAEQ
jgi:SOS-response transcriptional repressor LexA